MDINEQAPAVTHDSIIVNAPVDTVWRIHTNVARWPDWQPDVQVIRSVDPFPLRVGDRFAWSTAGLHIVSTVYEIDPLRRIVWGGPAHGIDGIHVWTFHDTAGGALVTTHESWEGPAVEADPAAHQAALDASLRSWLERLKAHAERLPVEP